MDGIMNIVYAILVLGIMGAVFGAILAFAAKIFHVEQDPRIDEVRAALAGAINWFNKKFRFARRKKTNGNGAEKKEESDKK